MFRTENSVGMLKTIAMIAGFAILLWSLGLPSLRFADAANVSSYSDELSDSAPSASTDHKITFTTPTGVAAGETIVIDFGANFNPSTLDFGDVDFASTTDITLAGSASGQTWGVSTDATSITLTSASGVIDAGDTVVIEIGLNATFGVAGDTQIANPAAEGSYEIVLGGTMSDSGNTRVVILTAVTVTATVDTIFEFTVDGTAAGTLIGAQASTGATGSTSIPFGKLTDVSATTSAQLLTVQTNAANGYVVTMQLDQPLQSSTGDNIKDFTEDTDINVPAVWDAPDGLIGSANTWGHWGVTSDDENITSRAGSEFEDNFFIAASTTPRDVMEHTGPVNGAGVGKGTTTVGYRIQISALQPAGDYSTTLTYVATPSF